MSRADVAERVPALRFPEFKGEWDKYTIDDVLRREGDPVEVKPDERYRQIGVRSHGRGLFHKDAVTGADLGGKRVFHVVPNSFVVNIVFAWEQAVALTTDGEEGFIASHRFPMYLEKDELSFLPFIREMFLRKRGKQLLELASPGGAGRNKTLGQQEFLKLKVTLPKREEQKKIAAFLGVVDAKIAGLKARQEGLERYKRGLMQTLFSQRLRFTKTDGTAFPDWEEKRLGEVFSERSERGNENAELLSVTMSRGVVRAADVDRANGASADRSNYKTVHINDIAYNSMRMWQGANGVSKHFGIVSPAYTVISPQEEQIPDFWGYYFKLTKVIQEFQRYSQGLTSDTWNLKFPALSSIKLNIPHPDEQQKIADALQAMDAKIEAVAGQVAKMNAFKKGLLQQMFV